MDRILLIFAISAKHFYPKNLETVETLSPFLLYKINPPRLSELAWTFFV